MHSPKVIQYYDIWFMGYSTYMPRYVDMYRVSVCVCMQVCVREEERWDTSWNKMRANYNLMTVNTQSTTQINISLNSSQDTSNWAKYFAHYIRNTPVLRLPLAKNTHTVKCFRTGRHYKATDFRTRTIIETCAVRNTGSSLTWTWKIKIKSLADLYMLQQVFELLAWKWS